MRIESTMWLAVLALSAGCSLMTDTTKKQCEKDDDCERLFGTDTLYQCVSNYCTRPTCSDNAQCQELGVANGVCGEDQRCKSGCSKNSDCGDKMACSAGTCEARECNVPADCPGMTGSTICNNGMCEDTVWGCIGEPDVRGPATEATATLRTTIVNATTRMPIRDGLTLTACRLAAYDPKCTKPLDGVTATYDPNSGVAVVSGLPQDATFRLKIDPAPASGLLPLDFYMQRPVRDVTEERQIVVLSEALVRQLAGGFSPAATIDPDEAALYLTVFDCQDRPAMGVALEVDKNDITPGTQIGYLESTGVSAALTSTGTLGQGNILNLPADKLVALSTKLNGETVSNYSVMPLAGRNTTVRFYPRKYE
jgi:hypothetical protein